MGCGIPLGMHLGGECVAQGWGVGCLERKSAKVRGRDLSGDKQNRYWGILAGRGAHLSYLGSYMAAFALQISSFPP